MASFLTVAIVLIISAPAAATTTAVSLDLGWRVEAYAAAPCGAFRALNGSTCLDMSPQQDSYHSWRV